MKNFIIQRYWLHLLVGICLGFIMGFLAKFYEFGNTDKVVADFATGVVIFIIAGLYEWGQTTYVQSKHPNTDSWDWKDVIYSGFGGLIGCGISYITQNKNVLIGSIVMIGLIVIFEAVRVYRTRNN